MSKEKETKPRLRDAVNNLARFIAVESASDSDGDTPRLPAVNAKDLHFLFTTATKASDAETLVRALWKINKEQETPGDAQALAFMKRAYLGRSLCVKQLEKTVGILFCISQYNFSRSFLIHFVIEILKEFYRLFSSASYVFFYNFGNLKSFVAS